MVGMKQSLTGSYEVETVGVVCKCASAQVKRENVF